MNTDYKIEKLEILLDESCLAERYYPLLPFRSLLLSKLPALCCKTKSDAEKLSDEELLGIGFDGIGKVRLFRAFLSLYDVTPQKMRKIEKTDADEEEKEAYRELYLLPGVKQVRAALYFRAGFRRLVDIAGMTQEELIKRCSLAIAEYGLSCIPPTPKEARTHIAVAKAFTE